MHDDAVLAIRRRWTAAAIGLLAVGCKQSPDGVDLSGGTVAADDGDDGSGSTSNATGSDDAPATDDTTGEPPMGGPCNSDEDCVDDPAGAVCDELLEVCGPGCEPGETRECYSGPPGTDGIGACTAGLNTCNDAGKWELWCDGEVIPVPETCEGGVDDDCDGRIDDTDQDGDGFGMCTGDCCDISGGACSDAELVNPGAYEVVGNDLDDDCNGETDEGQPTCDDALASDSNDALDFARALELCVVTEEEPKDPADQTWGIISAELTRTDGEGVPYAVQHRLSDRFGDIVTPEQGQRMVVLSSGHAADQDDTSPAYAAFQPGVNLGSASPVPSDWLDANGGELPNPGGCLPPTSTNANDPIMLTLRMRVPTNAQSFSVMMNFMSAEYPEWVCSEYNDFFVALVDSAADSNPPDKNIAIYSDGADAWPVGVNLAMIAEGLFTQCENGEIGCAQDFSSTYTGCLGTAQLQGTGFDAFDNGCGSPGQTVVGGGTGWLEMSGNVSPGEELTIRFAIWDTSGHIFDSVVLLDDWQWSLQAAEPGVAPG